MMEIEPVPVYFYDQNETSEIPVEYMDKTQGEERFRGNYDVLTILRAIDNISKRIVSLHTKMSSRCNFIRELNLLDTYHEQTYCIIPLCHYVIMCNYIRLSKTLFFKHPLFRRQGYTEDTDLHAFLDLWHKMGKLVDSSQTFYDNLVKLDSKCETDAREIVLDWATNMAQSLFRLRKKVHVLPEYAPIIPLIPYPPQVTACLRENFGVNTIGGSWEDFLNDPNNDSSDEYDYEAGDDTDEEPDTGFIGRSVPDEPEPADPNCDYDCDCASAVVAIIPKTNKEWKKHKIRNCDVCTFFQKKSELTSEEIPYETYLISTQSENADPDAHYCYAPIETEKEYCKNAADYWDYIDNKHAEELQKKKDSEHKESTSSHELGEKEEEKYVVTVPNHRFGTITNARIINALTKAEDPNAVFQNPDYEHATRYDYNLGTMSGCNEEDIPETYEDSDDEPEETERPPLTINVENLIEFFQQGWHNFPFSEDHGYIFPSFVKIITRYLYDMEPEEKEIATHYTKILKKTFVALIDKAFKSDPSTPLYKMRFHLQLLPEIYKVTLSGLEGVYQIGLQVIAYDIPNVNWTKQQMGDSYYSFVNMFNFETLSLLETAIHGEPGSCFSLTEWQIWLRIAALIAMKLLNKYQYHISCFSLEVL